MNSIAAINSEIQKSIHYSTPVNNAYVILLWFHKCRLDPLISLPKINSFSINVE